MTQPARKGKERRGRTHTDRQTDPLIDGCSPILYHIILHCVTKRQTSFISPTLCLSLALRQPCSQKKNGNGNGFPFSLMKIIQVDEYLDGPLYIFMIWSTVGRSQTLCPDAVAPYVSYPSRAKPVTNHQEVFSSVLWHLFRSCLYMVIWHHTWCRPMNGQQPKTDRWHLVAWTDNNLGRKVKVRRPGPYLLWTHWHTPGEPEGGRVNSPIGQA